MPVRADIRYEKDGNFNSESSVVEKAIQVDGFWVPKKVFRRTGTSVSDGQGENTYEVSVFSRNTVTDDDFKIEFPPGTEVVDTIAKVAYRVLPGGGIKMLPLVDSDTGELIRPIDTPIDEAIEDIHKEIMDGNVSAEPPKILEDPDSQEPNGQGPTGRKPPVVTAETPTGRETFWLGIAAMGIGALLVFLGLELVIAKRQGGQSRLKGD